MPSGWLWDENDEAEGAGRSVQPSSKRRTDLERQLKPASPSMTQAQRTAIPASTPPARPGMDPERPLSVTQLSAWIKGALEATIPTVWLEAEVSDLSRPSSGHIYLTLKDGESQMRGVIWRSSAARIPFELKDGASILCCGNLDVYGPRGTYQFVIQRAQPKGLGALQLAFQQLHAKLTREGLFDARRKKPLPNFPRRIGFVTSPSGAAVHDFLQVLKRRWQGIHVLIIPTRVQGDGAAKEIAQAIALAATIDPPLDVLVVGRGGGSQEDLWCFNEEPVVRAIASCPIPTVSAVGHEIDITLCDLAADVRALTPTEAAERILPDAEDLLDRLRATRSRLDHLLTSKFDAYRRRLELLSTRPAIANPQEMILRRAQRLDELQVRLQQGAARRIEVSRQKIERLAMTLEALSPLRVIQRGYGMVRHAESQRLITSVRQAQVGDRIETKLGDGTIVSRIESIE